MKRIAALLGALFCLAAAHDPADSLPNPAQEARARALFQETRCVVCQGESIDDSEALIAGDLRRAIREQVAAGATDDQVRAFLAARYGDFVLFRPRFTAVNALLWGAPFAVAIMGLGLLIRRKKVAEPTPALSAEEEARLASVSPTDGP